MDNTVLSTDGYRFDNRRDLECAELEKKKVEYFRARLNHQNVRSMLAVYDKILDDKMFVTPVGWEFLKSLQKELAEAGVPLEQLRPIPMYVTFAHDMDGNDREPVRQRIHTSPQKDTSKRRLHISLCINLVLAVLVALLFAIALNSENPNILNYEKALVNKYAAWEQELTQREQEVKQRESELEKEKGAALNAR